MTDTKNPFGHLLPPKKATTAIVGEPMTHAEFQQAMSEVKPTPEVKPASLSATKPTLGGVKPKVVTPEPVKNLPVALNPLTTLMKPSDFPEPQHVSHVIASGTVHELANLDTDSLEPHKRPEQPLNAKANDRTKQLTLSSGRSVREVCDNVDKILESDPQLRGPNLMYVRSYVSALMVTLKIHPEFDEVLIDGDVHNIMKFVRATREEALSLRDVKVEKKAKKASNKANSITTKAFGDSDKFDELFNKTIFGPMGGPK